MAAEPVEVSEAVSLRALPSSSSAGGAAAGTGAAGAVGARAGARAGAGPNTGARAGAGRGTRVAGSAATEPGAGVGVGAGGAEAADDDAQLTLADVLGVAVRAVEVLVERAAALEQEGPVAGRRALGALAGMDRLVSLVGVARASVVGVAQRSATPADLGGERDFTAWRATTSREGRGQAEAQGRLARTLSNLPQMRAAVNDGELTLGHAEALAQTLDRADERTRGRMAGTIETLIDAGRELPVPVFRRRLQAAAAALAVDSADRGFGAVRARRHLRLVPRAGGLAIEGFLDPVAGATLRTALDAVTPVPSAGDERSGEQRSADALVLLADRALGVGVDKAGAQVRPHLSVLVPVDTWALLVQRRRLQACAAGAAGRLSSEAAGAAFLQQEAPLAELLDGTLVPFAALEVLACDALTQRAVIDPDGVPLDLGRTSRTFVKDTRRAVLLRDRHCQWPGCTLRATWSEVHHITYWSRGGSTDPDQGITLCSAHHHTVHERGVRITPVRGGFTFCEQDGTRIGQTSRLRDELLVPTRHLSDARVTAGGPASGRSGAPPGARGVRGEVVNVPPGAGDVRTEPGAVSPEGRGRDASSDAGTPGVRPRRLARDVDADGVERTPDEDGLW